MPEGVAVREAEAPRRRAEPAVRPLLLFAVFVAVSLLVYRAALHGPFLSDDFGYIVSNPYTSGFGWANLRTILDPFGPARLYTANYAPVHLLLTALERQIFADDPFGYHVVNVLLLAANATMLVALLRASGLPAAGALAAGAVFLLHPANVEAVAWVSQLKSGLGLALALGALCLHPRRPAVAAALFALGLLTKASAAFAWPMACALVWARTPDGGRRAPRGRLARAVGAPVAAVRAAGVRVVRRRRRGGVHRVRQRRRAGRARSPRSARAIC